MINFARNFRLTFVIPFFIFLNISYASEIGLLVQNVSSLDTEELSAKNFAESKGFNVTIIDSSQISAGTINLSAFGGLWCHTNTEPTGYNSSTVINAVKTYVESGKNLLVSWQGKYLAEYLGVATVKTSGWWPCVSDESYIVDVKIQHPIFNGISSWIPPEGPPDTSAQLFWKINPGTRPRISLNPITSSSLTLVCIWTTYGWPYQTPNYDLGIEYGITPTNERNINYTYSPINEYSLGSGKVIEFSSSMGSNGEFTTHGIYGTAGEKIYENVLKYLTGILENNVYYIRGYIKDSGGSGVNEVTVNISGSTTRATLTNSSGFYEFTNLSTGDYTITPSKTNYTFSPASISATSLCDNLSNQNFIGIYSEPVQADKGNYFPLMSGNEWKYNYYGYDYYTYKMSVIGIKQIGERETFVVRESYDVYEQYGYYFENYYCVEADKVSSAGGKIYGFDGSFMEFFYEPPLPFLVYPLEQGKKYTIQNTTVTYKYYYADWTFQDSYEMSLSLQYEVISITETVTTPAGTFYDCVKISGGYTYFYLINYYLYYAKDVGIVKTSYYDPYSGAETDMLVLKSYNFAGAEKYYGYISGKVSLLNEATPEGIKVVALKDGLTISEAYTDATGNYVLTNLNPEEYYKVKAMAETIDGIISSAYQEVLPYSESDFTLNKSYEMATISGEISGIKSFSPLVSMSKVMKGNSSSMAGINKDAYVEMLKNNKPIRRYPVDSQGFFKIHNLLPAKYMIRAYNGYVFSESKTVNLSEGEYAITKFSFQNMPENGVYVYPNPAKTGEINFRFYCDYSNPECKIKVYNIAGELVSVIDDNKIDKSAKPIYYFKKWNCTNNSGRKLASGIYIYVLEARDRNSGEKSKVVKKFAIVK